MLVITACVPDEAAPLGPPMLYPAPGVAVKLALMADNVVPFSERRAPLRSNTPTSPGAHWIGTGVVAPPEARPVEESMTGRLPPALLVVFRVGGFCITGAVLVPPLAPQVNLFVAG